MKANETTLEYRWFVTPDLRQLELPNGRLRLQQRCYRYREDGYDFEWRDVPTVREPAPDLQGPRTNAERQVEWRVLNPEKSKNLARERMRKLRKDKGVRNEER